MHSEITPESHPELFEVAASPFAGTTPDFQQMVQALSPPPPRLVNEEGAPVEAFGPPQFSEEEQTAYRLLYQAWRVGLLVARRGPPQKLPAQPHLRPTPTLEKHVDAFRLLQRLPWESPELVDPSDPASEIIIREAAYHLGIVDLPRPLAPTWPPYEAWQALHQSWVVYAYTNFPLDPHTLAMALTQRLPKLPMGEAVDIARASVDQAVKLGTMAPEQLRDLLTQRAMQEAARSDKPLPAIKLAAELQGLLKSEKKSSLGEFFQTMMESSLPERESPREVLPEPVRQPLPIPTTPPRKAKLRWPD